MADRPATDRSRRPAFYGLPGGRSWRGWWTVLHPPYTAWHLSYVVIGSVLVPDPALSVLLATLAAFFLAVGVGAHALDELNGHPLGTSLGRRSLVAATAVGLAGAVALGVVGVVRQGPVLVPFIVAGVTLAVGYNAELFGGALHRDWVFAVAWGGFPVLTAYVAQARTLSAAAVAAAVAAVGLSAAQRALSSPARLLRRSARRVQGTVVLDDGSERVIDERALLVPLERALQAMSWGAVALAVALALDRMT
ncbi:MAG: hypothetical protein ACRDY3_12675 [Acidimicrobiales bacterium]